MDPATMIALGSAAASLLGSLFGGKKDQPSKMETYPTLGPSQIGAQDQVLQQVLAGLSGGPQGPYSFAPIRQQAESQFNQRTIPSIAQRFSGADAQRGSGFQQALGMAGAGLSEGLAGQEAQYNQQYLGNLMQMLQLGLQPRFGTTMTPGSTGGMNTFGQSMGALSNLGGQLAPMYQQQQNMNQLSSLFGQQNQQNRFNSNQNDINSIMDRIKGMNLGQTFNAGSPYMNMRSF